MDSGSTSVLGAGLALTAVSVYGLRYFGLDRKSLVAASVWLLTWAFIRTSFGLQFWMEDWGVWFTGSLAALIPVVFGNARWIRPPRLWRVLDLCALAALLAAFLEFTAGAVLGSAKIVSKPVQVSGLFAFVATGAFSLLEFREAQVLQRPTGLVTGEILVMLGALYAALSFLAPDKQGLPLSLAAILAGSVLIFFRVSAFLKQREEHRVLVEQAESTARAVPEYTGRSLECPEPHLWSMYDSMTAEVEVLDLLHSIVRALKPKLVVETGTFTGISSLRIAKGLQENGFGRLITCEFDPAVHAKAVARFRESTLHSYIDCRCCSSLDLEIGEPIDLLFCDSDLGVREREVRHFIARVNPFGLILMHDAGSRFGVVRDGAFRMESEGLISVITMSTPRGLVIAQKRSGRR